MDVKFGKVKVNNNIFLKALVNNSDENFFESKSNFTWNENKQKNLAPGSRINDYDSTILENNAYQSMPDELFKIEHKIDMLEQLLSKLNTEINTLESLGYDIQLYGLKDRKQKVEQELAELNKKYSELGLSAKISGQITSVMNLKSNGKTKIFSRLKKYLTKKVLAKISKKFDHNETMKEALDSLSNINISVDELIKMQIPYGETITRYEKLTAYLNKANVIHSQIYKNVDAITKKKVQ